MQCSVIITIYVLGCGSTNYHNVQCSIHLFSRVRGRGGGGGGVGVVIIMFTVLFTCPVGGGYHNVQCSIYLSSGVGGC